MSSVFDKILTSAPVNRQAAAGSTYQIEEESELLMLQRKAGNLMAAIKSLKDSKFAPKENLAGMGVELNATNMRINQLKGARSIRAKTSIPFYFMQVCEETFSGPEFRRLLKLAQQKLDEDICTPTN